MLLDHPQHLGEDPGPVHRGLSLKDQRTDSEGDGDETGDCG
jgi:hypothetical protein